MNVYGRPANNCVAHESKEALEESLKARAELQELVIKGLKLREIADALERFFERMAAWIK
jgi:hypothetical protein